MLIINKKAQPKQDFFVRNYLAGTQVVIGIARVVEVDLELAVVGIPVHVRHIAVSVARTR